MKPGREIDLISRLARKAGAAAAQDPDLLAGIGDDCAVIAHRGDGLLAVTTDTLVESVHFDLKYFDPWHLGRKTAGVNLSDMAAMGAMPRWAFLNIASRPGLPSGFWDEFTDGLLGRLSQFGAVLAGGDTVSSPDAVCLTLTLIGELMPGKRLGRAGARSGDIIYCSGYLGDAASGLQYLKAGSRYGYRCRRLFQTAGRSAIRRILDRHLDPEPRVALGRALAESGLVSAAIDLSDGVATDLAHVCQSSSAGAVVDASLLPISRAARLACLALGLSPVQLAISGGEDFELLWTVSPEHETHMIGTAAKALGHRPFRIGRVVEAEGVYLKTGGRFADITFSGYEHIV